MSSTPCSQCGHENRIGHLFCESCGSRLDLGDGPGGGPSSPLAVARRRKKRGRRRRRILATVYILLLALLVAAPLLAAWQPVVPVTRGAPVAAGRYRQGRDWAWAIVARGQGALWIVHEDNLNSHLAMMSGGNGDLPPMVATFTDGRATVFLSRSAMGISFVTSIHTKVGQAGDAQPPRRGWTWVGHLPIPPGLDRLWLRQYEAVGGHFERELQLFAVCIDAETPAAGQLALRVKAPSAAAGAPAAARGGTR